MKFLSHPVVRRIFRSTLRLFLFYMVYLKCFLNGIVVILLLHGTYFILLHLSFSLFSGHFRFKVLKKQNIVKLSFFIKEATIYHNIYTFSQNANVCRKTFLNSIRGVIVSILLLLCCFFQDNIFWLLFY